LIIYNCASEKTNSAIMPTCIREIEYRFNADYFNMRGIGYLNL